jgi:hypothetical protein
MSDPKLKCSKCGQAPCTCKERESDTIAASIVRDTMGDEAARDFKSIFGDWF